MTHPHEDKTGEEIEERILEIIRHDKDKSASFEILEVNLGKSFTDETLRQTLENLVKERKIIKKGRCFPNKPVYNLK